MCAYIQQYSTWFLERGLTPFLPFGLVAIGPVAYVWLLYLRIKHMNHGIFQVLISGGTVIALTLIHQILLILF